MTTRRRRRHSPEQIVRKLRDADAMLSAGKDEAAVLQVLEVSQSTYERWRRQYGGMKAEEARRLKELEEENKRLKELVAELTLECLALKVDRSITSEDVIDTLAELFAMRGVPQCIRSDNGPEFIAGAIRRWLRQVDVEALYIEPGSPWENGYAESFHSRVRDEFLALEVFESLSAAKRLTRMWRDDYNENRPHSSLGYMPPAEFAAR